MSRAHRVEERLRTTYRQMIRLGVAFGLGSLQQKAQRIAAVNKMPAEPPRIELHQQMPGGHYLKVFCNVFELIADLCNGCCRRDRAHARFNLFLNVFIDIGETRHRSTPLVVTSALSRPE